MSFRTALLGAAVLPGLVAGTSADGPTGSWPVPSHRVVSAFRPPVAAWSAGHRGVDLDAVPGEAVRAILPGVIRYAGQVAGKPVVTVSLAGGRRLTFEPVLGRVPVGTPVQQGQVIGVVARSGGHCGAVDCLHVGLIGPEGYADPLVLLPRGHPVLKPLH